MRLSIATILLGLLINAPLQRALAQLTGMPEARRISLDEAIRLAQANSPQAVQARGQLRTARVALHGARLAFLPNLNLSMGSNWSRGQRIGQAGSLIDFTGPSKSYSDGISANLQLFDGGRRFFEISSSRADVEAADAGETVAQYQVALQVKQQYYAVLAARESQASAQAQLAEAEQQLRAATARMQAGAAIRSDSLRSAVQLGNATLAFLNAETSLANASAALTRLTGSESPVTAADAPAAEALPALDVAQLEALALEGPAVVQARAQVVSARATRRSAQTSYLPTINMNYNRGGSGFDSRFGYRNVFAYSSSFRLSVSLPLFDQLGRERQLVGATSAEDNAEASLRDAELRARQDLVQLLGLLRNAEQRVAVQQSSVQAAEADLSIQQQRYALGASSLVDILQSQSALNQARAALISARYDARIARAQLEALIGRDLNSLQ